MTIEEMVGIAKVVEIEITAGVVEEEEATVVTMMADTIEDTVGIGVVAAEVITNERGMMTWMDQQTYCLTSLSLET